MKELVVNSFDKFLQIIKEITCKWNLPTGISPWFRGQNNSNDHLKPGIFRQAIKEQDISNTFIMRAGIYLRDLKPTSSAQWLSYMQHVGIPTRLLDWTESPLVALFFAVNSLNKYNNTNMDAGVWILHPLELNKLSNIALFPASNTSPVCYSYQQAFEDRTVKGIREYPISVYSTYIHSRMPAQRSFFTIHGLNRESFELQLERTSMITNNFFVKLIIPKNLKSEFNKELKLLGIRYNTLFPDIEGLVYELKEEFC